MLSPFQTISLPTGRKASLDKAADRMRLAVASTIVRLMVLQDAPGK